MDPADLFSSILGLSNDAASEAVSEVVAGKQSQLATTEADEEEEEAHAWDCVLPSEKNRGRPKEYEGGVPLKTREGKVCGFRMQITNKNEEFGFSVNILRNEEAAASALGLGGLILATMLAYF